MTLLPRWVSTGVLFRGVDDCCRPLSRPGPGSSPSYPSDPSVETGRRQWEGTTVDDSGVPVPGVSSVPHPHTSPTRPTDPSRIRSTTVDEFGVPRTGATGYRVGKWVKGPFGPTSPASFPDPDLYGIDLGPDEVPGAPLHVPALPPSGLLRTLKGPRVGVTSGKSFAGTSDTRTGWGRVESGESTAGRVEVRVKPRFGKVGRGRVRRERGDLRVYGY